MDLSQGPRIQRLPDDLVNKIAAGEVVERPASVVKELIENALDAEARSVVVEIEAGGKRRIRVRDDGAGMGPQDARLAVERHATSKLRSLEDLSAIASHGFRGEALASIASVSLLRLTTCEEGSSAGSVVEIRHGRLARAGEAGHPRGTSVEVRDLFGAVPARRKFLRADATEAGHVAETVTLYALAHPEVGFRLVSNERATLEAPPVASLDARVHQLLGPEARESLVPVDGGEEWARVRGLVTRAVRGGPGRPLLRLFVNGRPIRDRAVLKAVAEAYRASGVADPRPEGCLFLEVPLHLVDVNVHPTKAEVRFADPGLVFRAVERAVRQALSESARRPSEAVGTSRVAEAVERYVAREAGREAGPRRIEFGAPVERGEPGGATGGSRRPEATEPPPIVLGQHRNTYIVATDGEELLLVDQHTAHERVRFEALTERLERRSVESQRLLTPWVGRLVPRLRPVLEAHAAALGELGFEVEPFGGDSFRVGAVPALLGGRDPGPALEGLLRELIERESTSWTVASARDRLAATLACHSAARAGDPLSREQMAAIVRDLLAARHPTLCPHGRPTLVRVPREELARWFGRGGWRRT